VERESPAANAGLREGDVIVSFNGESVGNIHELHRLLLAEQIGVESKIVIIRHTEKLELAIFPAESRSRG